MLRLYPVLGGFIKLFVDSFQTNGGGFEAFVDNGGYLHVALTAADHSFHSVDVSQQLLADGHWVRKIYCDVSEWIKVSRVCVVSYLVIK